MGRVGGRQLQPVVGGRCSGSHLMAVDSCKSHTHSLMSELSGLIEQCVDTGCFKLNESKLVRSKARGAERSGGGSLAEERSGGSLVENAIRVS